MNIKKIINFLFHPTTIKIVGLIGIVGFFFILPTFAQDVTNNTNSSTLKAAQELLQKFLSLCSRWWIVLAILAGKLMTNDFVYGAFIHMDIYLWKIWNIMKNFANFALIGLVLVSIVKSLVGKEALDVKKTITNTLIAGILIQASWFLMGALIDVSTVATASIGAFPVSFLKTDKNLQNNITNTMTQFQWQRLMVDLSTWGNKSFTVIPPPPWTITETPDRESILPDQDSISWPFIYLGMGVFSFQNYLTTDISTSLPTLTLGFALRFFLMFLFTVGLLLLLVANIMRVGLLWIFIIWSPFLILMQVFNKKAGDWWLGKIFSLSNLIAIAFKPVIFVAGMSLMLIVIVSMQNSITWSWATRENNLNGVSLGKSGNDISTLNVQWISNIAINQKDILGKDVIGPDALGQTQNFFSHLIMLLLSIFLMRQFIKLSLTIGWWPIEDTMKKLTSLAEGFAKTAPILPWWISTSGASSIMSKNSDKLLGWFGMNKSGEFGEWDGRNLTTNETKFSNRMNDKAWLQKPWTPNDDKELDRIAKWDTYANFFTASQDKAKQREWGLSITNTEWMKSMKLLLGDYTKFWVVNWKIDPASKFTKRREDNQTPEQYFSIQQNIKALYDIMWWFPASKANLPQTYEELKNITFYPGRE